MTLTWEAENIRLWLIHMQTTAICYLHP